MTIILFDDSSRESLLPLTFTRPVAEIRIGILTITEKWEKYLNAEASFLTADYLQEKYALTKSDYNLFINGAVCPDEALLEEISKLKAGEALIQNQVVIAVNTGVDADFNFSNLYEFAKIEFKDKFTRIVYPEDIFRNNDAEIRKDYKLLTAGKASARLSNTNTFLGDNIFAEEGVQAECSTFNAKDGPIYLGKNSQVWEGCHVRGSFALCHDSQVKMGAKIYGMTTIGPYCKAGGEINNSVMFGYSSKGHDGFLGNSVLGEWCNIGADSNNSNLKNNYAEVRLWDYNNQSFRRTGLQFCGLIMADHAKCGINTMFNTGTVVGVSANIFGSGYPRNFVPDFAWGGAHGFEVYSLKKMFETAELVFERREQVFGKTEKDIITKIFELTEQHRRFKSEP